jgi:hypothetical protein
VKLNSFGGFVVNSPESHLLNYNNTITNAKGSILNPPIVLPRYYNRDIIKTRQASHGLNETRKKGYWTNNATRRGERDEHTLFEINGHVQMAKSDVEAQTKSSLSDCTWLER